MSSIEQRMQELMDPIDQQLKMCNDSNDALMMACAMLQRTREVFDQILGPEGRMKMFTDYATKTDLKQSFH
jgi:hypothetical protein